LKALLLSNLNLLPKRAITHTVDPALLKTHGKNSPFKDRKLYGKILMTLHKWRVVFCVWYIVESTVVIYLY